MIDGMRKNKQTTVYYVTTVCDSGKPICLVPGSHPTRSLSPTCNLARRNHAGWDQGVFIYYTSRWVGVHDLYTP